MKTFLKVVLLVLAALLVVKLVPVTLLCGVGLALGLIALAVLGVSALALFICVMLGLAAVLSPIWIPILALVGVIALIKKLSAKPKTA